jgi:cytoskeleton protein RodZ
MQVDFDSLGSYLRQERERQQVALQDVAAATKIQLKFLEALEHDAYDQLPAVPFVVGFLRAYAQYIALDPEMVLTAYRSLHRTPEPPDMASRPGPAPPPSPHRGQVIRLGVFLAVFGVITGVVLHELRRGQPTRGPVASFPAVLPGQAEYATDTSRSVVPVVPRTEPSGAASAVPTFPTPAARGEQGPGLTVLGASEAAALPAPPAAPGAPTSAPGTSPAREGGGAESPGALVLQARAVADTWLRVEIDGGKRLTLLLTSGKSVQWEAHERFRLTVGNVRGIRLALNGQELPLQAGRGNVMRNVLLTRALLH